MSNLRHSLGEFRDQLVSDKKGSNAEKLAFALGFFEALLIGLCNDPKNVRIIQRKITQYMENR